MVTRTHLSRYKRKRIGKPNPGDFSKALNSRPKSTQNLIVFPYSESKSSYTKTNFNPQVIQGRMNNSDIEQFFQDLKNCPDYHLKHFGGKPFALVLVFFTLGVIIGALLTGFVIPVILLVFFFIYLIYLNKKKKEHLKKRQTQFEGVAQLYNSKLKSKMIRWAIGRYGAYICLHLDFIPKGWAPQNNLGAGNLSKLTKKSPHNSESYPYPQMQISQNPMTQAALGYPTQPYMMNAPAFENNSHPQYQVGQNQSINSLSVPGGNNYAPPQTEGNIIPKIQTISVAPNYPTQNTNQFAKTQF